MATLDNYMRDLNRRIEKGLQKAAFRVEADAKKDCPVDTGNLRASINSNVRGLTAEIGTNVEYAAEVEFGTYKQRPQPYLRPALVKNKRYIIKDIQDAIGGV